MPLVPDLAVPAAHGRQLFPLALAIIPGGHSVHPSPAFAALVPVGQGAHCPSEEEGPMPASQLKVIHAVRDSFDVCPAGHCVQSFPSIMKPATHVHFPLGVLRSSQAKKLPILLGSLFAGQASQAADA